MCTRFRNNGNVPTEYAASTASNQTVKLPKHFANSYGLHEYQVANERCVDRGGRRYVCAWTEESSWLWASALLHVKTSVCTRAIKDGETDDKVTCRYVQVI